MKFLFKIDFVHSKKVDAQRLFNYLIKEHKIEDINIVYEFCANNSMLGVDRVDVTDFLETCYNCCVTLEFLGCDNEPNNFTNNSSD